MNILIAVDFSAVTGRIVEALIRFATQPAAHTMYLVHVTPPEPAFVGYDAGPGTLRDQVAHELRELHAELTRHAGELRAAGCVVTPLLLQGPTIDTVLAEADRLAVDLLVVGSHGHGAVYDLLVGSVSEGLVRRSKRPVLVIPAS